MSEDTKRCCLLLRYQKNRHSHFASPKCATGQVLTLSALTFVIFSMTDTSVMHSGQQSNGDLGILPKDTNTLVLAGLKLMVYWSWILYCSTRPHMLPNDLFHFLLLVSQILYWQNCACQFAEPCYLHDLYSCIDSSECFYALLNILLFWDTRFYHLSDDMSHIFIIETI